MTQELSSHKKDPVLMTVPCNILPRYSKEPQVYSQGHFIWQFEIAVRTFLYN